MKPYPCLKDVMSHPVHRLHAEDTVREAAVDLLRWGVSGAAVVDTRGRPVGVFSLRDMAHHVQHRFAKPENFNELMDLLPGGETAPVEGVDTLRVADLMTPNVVSALPEAPLSEAIAAMVSHRIHRVFVIGHEGQLEGVITTLDVMRWLNESREETRRRTAKVTHA